MLKPFSNELPKSLPEKEAAPESKPDIKPLKRPTHYARTSKWRSGVEESDPETHKDREEMSGENDQ
jgi:hypothetical protein